MKSPKLAGLYACKPTIVPDYMKLIPLCLLLCLTRSLPTCAQGRDSLMAALHQAMEASPVYDSVKLGTIHRLEAALADSGSVSPPSRYAIYLQLFNEYKSFKYDSAYAYARKLEAVAYEMKDPARIIYARIKLGFTLVSSGLFKETFDSLNTLNAAGAPDSIRAEFYSLMGRYYYDLGDFDNDSYYTAEYNKKGSIYIDSALALYPENSFQYSYFHGLQLIRRGRMDEATQSFRRIIGWSDLTPHQLALVASTLSDIYIRKDETDTATDLLIRAAIADIQSSTKETSAALNLAELLFRKGDVRNASVYIERGVLWGPAKEDPGRGHPAHHRGREDRIRGGPAPDPDRLCFRGDALAGGAGRPGIRHFPPGP
jgi:Tfp pilus assembly protein PilF